MLSEKTISSMSKSELEELMTRNLKKIFSLNTMFADVAMYADTRSGIEIKEYEGAFTIVSDLQHEYKLAEKELQQRHEKRVAELEAAQ